MSDSCGSDRAPRDPMQTLVPNGRYEVVYRSYEKGFPFGQERWFVHFEIVEPSEHAGKLLIRFVNIPPSWKGKRKGARVRSPGRSSNLGQDFITITGKRPPDRVTHPPDIYGGSMLTVLAEEVRETSDGKTRSPVPESARYSKIERIVGVIAGPHSHGMLNRSGRELELQHQPQPKQ